MDGAQVLDTAVVRPLLGQLRTQEPRIQEHVTSKVSILARCGLGAL